MGFRVLKVEWRIKWKRENGKWNGNWDYTGVYRV